MTIALSSCQRIQQKLIEAGVRNLKKYGYRDVSPENILRDPIYSAFFREMLNDHLGNSFDVHIQAVLARLPGRSA